MHFNTEHSGMAILLLLIALPIAGFLYGFRKGRANIGARQDKPPPPSPAETEER